MDILKEIALFPSSYLVKMHFYKLNWLNRKKKSYDHYILFLRYFLGYKSKLFLLVLTDVYLIFDTFLVCMINEHISVDQHYLYVCHFTVCASFFLLMYPRVCCSQTSIFCGDVLSSCHNLIYYQQLFVIRQKYPLLQVKKLK